MATFSRYNARKGNIVELKREFYHNSILQDPDSIEKVEIHKVAYDSESPADSLIATIESASVVAESTGKHRVDWDIPETVDADYIYLDVWHYKVSPTASVTIDSSSQFKIFEDHWFTQDGTTNYKYQLFPDIKTFTKGEKRNIELQIVPLPLYNTSDKLDDYILPITDIQVKVETKGQELVLDWTNTITQNLANKAYVHIDTTLPEYRKGVYFYWVKLGLPNSDIIISQRFAFNII